MEKLTPSQIEKLSVVLAMQFIGKQIAFGNKYGYNFHKIFHGTMAYSPSSKHMYLDDSQECVNSVSGKSLMKIRCWKIMDTPYNQYHKMVTINVLELLKYANGNHVVEKALKMVQALTK
jgi:hypothetical protein